MKHFKLSDDHYHRKCYFEREQVPTQSVMKDKMRALAPIYFKSMRPALKVLAGTQPPMKGGGNDWYVPPKDLLEGRAVLKPVKKQHLMKLGFNGIDYFGDSIVKAHHKSMEEMKCRLLLENDLKWKQAIVESCQRQWDETSKGEAEMNTRRIQQAFKEFSNLYAVSINKIESLLIDAARKEVQRVRLGAQKRMQERYESLLKKQATMLYDRYTKRLADEQARLKADFVENINTARKDLGHQLHDINVEKHVAVEKLRNLLECQNLACQVYVALKEREECKKEVDLSKHEHEKKVKALKEQIAMHDFELRLEVEKERKRHEFNKVWKKKICHVVKKFQIFVEYCLHLLPEQAEFFINMEKLMMLQLSEASVNPSAESIFEEEAEFHTPAPKPHPFYLFCEKDKPQVDQKLCPKHCTSSSSQLPVVIVNKRCIYAACDNFGVFSDKVTYYINGQRGDDIDLEDDHDYRYAIPVKCTSSKQLLELKLESSLMQVLQKELPNTKGVGTECCVCGIPYCFCSPTTATAMPVPMHEPKKDPIMPAIPSGSKIETRSGELEHEREPKLDSYLDYVKPKTCVCAITAKKHLAEHLPAYMRNMSKFEQPELPNYETCPLITLKKLVKKAKRRPVVPPEIPVESKTKDTSTQYEDRNFEYMCNCFSDEEIAKIFEAFVKGSKIFDLEKVPYKCEVVDGSITPTQMAQSLSTFATRRAFSLRNLLNDDTELQEIFRQENCKYD